MTTIITYQNKRNENKYLEVHNDGHYHNSVRQYLKWPNGVKYLVGDRLLHRWRKSDLCELLTDYCIADMVQATNIEQQKHDKQIINDT